MFKKEYALLTSLSLRPQIICACANYVLRSISPGSKSKVKSSVQRAIRTQIVNTYPLLAPYIDEIIPKKEQLDAMKMCVLLRSPYPRPACARAPHFPSTTLKITFGIVDANCCINVQTRKSNALPHRPHPPLLPTHDRRSAPPPAPCAPLSNRLPCSAHRSRGNPIRALWGHFNGPRLNLHRRSPPLWKF